MATIVDIYSVEADRAEPTGPLRGAIVLVEEILRPHEFLAAGL